MARQAQRAVFVALCGAFLAAHAAAPPTVVNYQGVLRSASNAPLTGTYDMEFRFWSAASGGNEILIDRHTAALGSAVAVSGGLFNVHLGEGSVSDGSGPGAYTDLAAVFRDHAAVWLAIRVGAEDLNPRTQLVSAAYSLNASNLGGKAPSEFLDTSASGQTKSGPLTVVSPGAGTNGVTASGVGSGGVFFDADASGYAYVGYGNQGVYASGTSMGGEFHDTNSSGYAYLGWGDTGIYGFGSFDGAKFDQLGGLAHASLASGGNGIIASGLSGGGSFSDTSGTGVAYCGSENTGVVASGSSAGGEFRQSGGTGLAYLGKSGLGVEASGGTAGGLFSDNGESGIAFVGYGHLGIDGAGTTAGGYFHDSNGSGRSYAGYGDMGVFGEGTLVGGYFHGTGGGSTGATWAGYADLGIRASGSEAGGYFYDPWEGGEAYLGYGDRGIWAKGTFAGGTFSHPNDVSFWADVATPTKKITGTGSVSFVQNHPTDPSRVIVYTAPEGNEVATYTRGSARLEGGIAHIALDDTFAMVTNPDVGLTAHLTARGDESSLYVASLTTRELVVKSGSGSPDTAFDYLVYGLRLGFEQEAVIQAKDREALLPEPGAFEARLQGAPEARDRTPLARFARMQGATPETLDLSATHSLEAAVHDAGARGLGRVAQEAANRNATVTTPSSTARVEPVVAPDPFAGLPRFPVSESVEAGEVLALDPEHPGLLRRALGAADPNVIGIAAGGGSEAIPVIGSGFAEVRVDAGYGEIRPGDLLTASPTQGLAMRGHEPLPGTVLGKAVESLASGTGTIRILVMPH